MRIPYFSHFVNPGPKIRKRPADACSIQKGERAFGGRIGPERWLRCGWVVEGVGRGANGLGGFEEVDDAGSDRRMEVGARARSIFWQAIDLRCAWWIEAERFDLVRRTKDKCSSNHLLHLAFHIDLVYAHDCATDVVVHVTEIELSTVEVFVAGDRLCARLSLLVKYLPTCHRAGDDQGDSEDSGHDFGREFERFDLLLTELHGILRICCDCFRPNAKKRTQNCD